MGIKNAGKAKIKKNLGKAPTKESVDTPMSECKAENPLECRYHGLQALEQQLSALLPAMGYKVPFGTDKLQGGKGFEIRIDGKFDVDQGEFKQSLTDAFKKQGWDLTYNGKVEGAGHSFTLKKGNAKPLETTEEDDKDKDDVDLVDDGLFDDLDDLAGLELREEAKNTASKDGDIDLMPLVGNPDALKDTDESDITLKDIEDFLAKNGTTKEHHYGDTPWEEILANWEGLIKNGKAPNGSELEGLIDYAKGYMDAAGEDHKVTKALKAKIAELTGEDVETKQEKKPSFEDAKDFLTKGHILEGDISDLEENIWGPIVFTGHYQYGGEVGEPWLEKFEAAVKELSDHPVTPYVKKWLNKAAEIDEAENLEVDLDELDELAGSEMSDFDAPLEEAEGEAKGDDDILKDSWSLTGATKQKEATDKDMVEGFKESEAKQESPASAIIGGLDESLMKPLEHDESKFPPSLTQKELDAAIAKGGKAGGNGGLHTKIIEIGGKKYICKNGAGKKSNIIKNGFNADMAYRAGGVYAPDAKLYEFGDGKTYKLSEFIEGKTLWDVWRSADESKRSQIRKEILKGYPLDVLFSNYDVLGTSPEVINDHETLTIQGPDGKPHKTHVAFDNIIIGDDGHVYRIDNDGSFAMKGNGNPKGANWTWAEETTEDGKVVKDANGKPKLIKVSAIFGKNASVAHEFYDNWDERQWIDDFRTMRRNERCAGIFDRYSTADIFFAAGNINLDNAVSSLPEQLQNALAKPLFEMKQMTYRAVNIALGGYKNNGFVSMALDASYEASKKRLREQCQLAVAWNNPGFGKYKEHWGNYQPQPFGEKPPESPEDPRTVLGSKLKNEDYTGSKIGQIIFSAAKTINYHGGEKKFDEKGKPIGKPMEKPDYDPNASKIADWEKIDREKLAELAKTDENAKTLLGLYDTIAYSKENGWKKPIGLVPQGLEIKGNLDADYKSPTEKKILEDMASAIEEFKAKEKKYRKELIEYEKRKSEHKKKEEEKALAAGGSPYHNFHHFAQALMEEGINTDGIAHKVQTNGIKPIESSMHSQKGSSYNEDAVKWKVREMMALGYSPQQILDMAEAGKLYNGSYYIGCINSSLLPNKESWDRDMNSQAMYLGLNMLKMENEKSDLYDKKSGVVFLNRNIKNVPQGISTAEKAIYDSTTKTGWIGPHIDSAADCMQFEDNSWPKPKKQVYAVPLSRIVCCANNETQNGVHQDYGYGENEYVGNLYQLPCWVYHEQNHLTWKNAIDQAKKSEGMTALLKKFATRLAAFNTLE